MGVALYTTLSALVGLFQGIDADIAYVVILVLVAVWSAVLPFLRDVLAEVFIVFFAVVVAFWC